LTGAFRLTPEGESKKMDEKNNKTVLLNVRIRNVDRALLEALCECEGVNLSEGVRRAIVNEAERQGFYNVAGYVFVKENDHERL
jgi:hypothetical protein